MTLELEIDDATQYATAYLDGKPVATVQRRRVYEKGPAWQAFATDGTLILRTYLPSVEHLRWRLALELEKRNAKLGLSDNAAVRYAHIVSKGKKFALLINTNCQPTETAWHVWLGRDAGLSKRECRTMAKDWRARPWNF